MINANQDRIKQAFEKPQWYLTKTEYNIKVRVATVKEFVKDTAPRKILDIGCGDGSLSSHLLNENSRLTLIDRSKSMLEIAAARIPPELSSHVEILNQDFMAAQLAEKSYDLVICVGVLAYVEQLRLFLAKIASVLAPGGTVIMECSDGSHFIRRAYRAYSALRRNLGTGEFETVARSSAEVVETFKELGFEPIGRFRYSQTLPVLRKILPQSLSYEAVRLIYGNATHNRASWLGSECIYHFKPANR
jgi:ubiquinone/menaquinone biosynthesis C-methylase UbiE